MYYVLITRPDGILVGPIVVITYIPRLLVVGITRHRQYTHPSCIVRGMSGNDIPNEFRDMVSLGVLARACELSHNQKVVLILDEIDKAHPSTDALLLLDFLQSARLIIPHIGEFKHGTKNLVVYLQRTMSVVWQNPYCVDAD